LKPRFRREAKLLLASSGLFAISFYGLQNIVKVLYILRLGHGPEYLGFFSSLSAFMFMAMSLPAGALGDRFGRKNIMVLGGSITILGMLLLPLTESVPLGLQRIWPILSQIVLTTGWPMFTVNFVPFLMAVTTLENSSRAYALNSTLKGLGIFVGTLLGGSLPGIFAAAVGQNLESSSPFRTTLFVAVLLSLTAMIPLFLIKAGKRVDRKQQEKTDEKFPYLLIFLLVLYICLFHTVWALVRVFCTAYMDADLNLTPFSIGLIAAAGQFVAILAPLLVPALTARRGSGWAVMATSIGMIVVLFPLVAFHHWAAVGISSMGIFALSAVWMPLLQIYQMEMVANRWRSLAYGAISMALGFSFGAFSLIGGYVAAAWGYRSLFWLGIALTTAGAVVMGSILRRQKTQ